jgi:hypothetical protein
LVGELYYPGYGLYLLEMFLPGLGIGEVLSFWKKEDSLAEKLGLALGLGLAFDTLVLAIRTSGITVLGETLRGVDLPTVYFIIAVGLVALPAAWFRKRRLDVLGMPTRSDLAMALLTIALGVMVALHFAKYPIFPAFASQDPALHTATALGLVSGAVTSFPGGVLYYGVHYQLASALLLVGGEPLITVQWTMGVLVLLSPLVVYTASKRILASSRAGLVTVAIYALSGPIWFTSVFGTGLYANFFGILACLFFLVAFLQIAEGIRNPRSWVVFSLALVMIYFSHYSSVTLFPALLILPLVRFAFERRDVKRYFLPALVALVPAAVALVAFPNLFSLLLSKAFGFEEQALFGRTVLSAALAAVPVMGYMAFVIADDVAFVLLLLLAVISVSYSIVSRRSSSLVPCLWFLSLIVVAPWNENAWRFSYEALVPLTIMAGYGISSLLPKSRVPKRRRLGSGQGRLNLKVAIVIVLLLSPIVVGSWGEKDITDALADTGTTAQAQQDVYSAMYWLKNNTPAGSRYLSVSDWRFVYTDLFFGRNTSYTYAATPSDGLALAKQYGDQFVIVTFYVTLQLPSNPSLYPWVNYQASSNLSLIFSNNDVRIFKIVG